MDNGVRFIRRNGRVIPIRASNDLGGRKNGRQTVAPSKRKQGAATVAGGVATAGAAGFASAVLKKEAASVENFSLGQRLKYHASRAAAEAGDLFSASARRAAAQHKTLAARARLHGMQYTAGARNIRKGGAVAGSALIAKGVDDMLPEKVKKNKVARAAADTSAGAAAAFTIRAVQERFLQPKLTRTPPGSPPGTASKAVNATWAAVKHAAKRVGARGIKL